MSSRPLAVGAEIVIRNNNFDFVFHPPDSDEEKLTVDSCLCDACFRHVDRRANCASYKKRLAAPPPKTDSLIEFESNAAETDEKSLQQNPNATVSEATLFQSNKEPVDCMVAECTQQASHSLRRKWALKLRKTIAKSIAINFDNTNSQTFLPICDKHCDDIGHMLVCVLCNRKLKTRQSFFINKVRCTSGDLATEQY